MIRKKWLVLLVAAMLVIMSSQIGIAGGSFIDQEISTGNSLQSWSSRLLVQTTQADFNFGVLNNVDISSSPGDVLLSTVAKPALITYDDKEVSVSGDNAWHLVKTITFNKNGSIYNRLRIDSNLHATKPAAAYSSIRVDDVEVLKYSTTAEPYQSYSDVLDFSSYHDGLHTVTLYLETENKNRSAYNSVFELYLINTYNSSGTIVSQVLDTGLPGDRWDALFLYEVLQKNTNITFEVRASDIPFTKDDVTLTWTSVGGASIIISGLPSGRYKQWRATLTTSDVSITPALNEVRVYYY